MIKGVNPYVNFNGNTEQAFEFYRSVFGGDFLGVVRYRDFPAMGAADADLDRIAHIALPLGEDNMLMGTDVSESAGHRLNAGNNLYIHLEMDGTEEATRVFEALTAGGDAEMPLSKTEWAELFGSGTDPFGVKWMISFTGDVQFDHDTTG
jgi:PhnB protein